MAQRYRILSIDGGGIRGIIPAVVLAEIEQRSGKRIFELFDMFAGTSTGGILSLALAAPGDDRGARWSARDLIALYLENGPVIFRRSLWHRITSAGSILDEKYEASGLESVLKKSFGEAQLSEALVEVLVTAYDIEGRDPFFFKRRKAIQANEDDYPMWEAARATSSAPTYFEPYRLKTESPVGYYALVDGGVFATNPSMCAYADARRFEPLPERRVLQAQEAGRRRGRAGAFALLPRHVRAGHRAHGPPRPPDQHPLRGREGLGRPRMGTPDT